MLRRHVIHFSLVTMLLFAIPFVGHAHGDENYEMSQTEYVIRAVSCVALPLSLALLWGKKDRVASERLESALRRANQEAERQQTQKSA